MAELLGFGAFGMCLAPRSRSVPPLGHETLQPKPVGDVMRRFFVRRLFLFLLPAIAGCGLAEILEPDVIDDEPEIRSFEEAVESVDVDERELTLADGTVLQVVDGTEREEDDWGRTFSLADAADALEMGWTVRAWGEGEVQEAEDEPDTIRSDRLGLSIAQPRREFEGKVGTVELEDGTLCLEDFLITLAAHTVFLPDANGEIHDLATVHQALANGRRVVAWGLAEIDPEKESHLTALEIGFEIEEPVLEDFEDVVDRVLLDHRKIQLVAGTWVRVTDQTVLRLDNGESTDLETVHAALEDGREVVARGVGEVAGLEPLILDGLEIVFAIEAPTPGVESFGGVIDYINFLNSEIVLRTTLGQVVVVALGTTQFSAADALSPATLRDADSAVLNGRRIRVTGTGTLEPVASPTYTALTVVFEAETEQFDNDVVSTDGFFSFTLDDGRQVQLYGMDTNVIPFDAGSPTDIWGIQAALDAGDRVTATGFGFVLELGPGYTGPSLLDAGDVTIRRIPAGS